MRFKGQHYFDERQEFNNKGSDKFGRERREAHIDKQKNPEKDYA